MVKVEPIVAKTVGALGIGTFLCCLALTTIVRGANSVTPEAVTSQVGAPPQVGIAFNPQVDCPDAVLSSIDNINLKNVVAFKAGISGLPCNAEIETNNKPSLTRRLQDGFDYYSWLTFIALNSPQDGTPIGKDSPTVWETYKQLPDVMLKEGKPPTNWSDPNMPVIPAECTGLFKSGMMIIHMEMHETYNEPFKSGPLFDQNGNYALFVILMNHQMFQYISDNTLYSKKGQQAFEGEVDFPNGVKVNNSVKGTVGAIMIKASWKILKPNVDYDPDNPDNSKIVPKYHMIEGLLYRPGSRGSCRQVKLGLIGFHVGHKTENRQQWIWTTFEHHDNVPAQSEVDNGSAKSKQYSFYDPKCSTCTINQTPPWPWDPEEMRPPWDPEKPKPTDSFRSQIVRMGPSPIFDDVDKLNQAFHKRLLGTVWENYDLVTTQWPSGPCANNRHPGLLPDATCAPFPTYLANSTLETFSQQEKSAGVPLATSSCISCHNNATTQHIPATRSDFTFILEKAQ